ncbi:DUF4157 domain-containing protein [Lapillicoccus sp.]|uniref:eCIS core domain-containing protein n=1 Tax=Lapillicoccus sp. TaxID=1909287 RepID=UPI003267712D
MSSFPSIPSTPARPDAAAPGPAADIRQSAQEGQPLDPGVRRALEAGFDVDLTRVRVHHDRRSDRLARSMHTDALASGAHLFFRSGAYQPATDAGFELLAHEVAHTVQQSLESPAGPWAERAAEVAAIQVTHGRSTRLGRGLAAVRPAAAGETVLVHRHESFEHRALGDLPTGDIVSLTNPGTRAEIIAREKELMWLWHQSPEQVTAEQVEKKCPWIRTIRLEPSGMLVTYGELNALPDYIASAVAIDSCPPEVLLPILQVIRQETFHALGKLGGSTTNIQFAKAPFPPSQYPIELLDKIFASWDLDALTLNLGIDGIDHYTGLLARNACHFSPFTWHRWQASYLSARDFAVKAHAASDSNERARLEHQAWLHHGYADHFLQDSFAAGHLINKTLAMQWFIEWAAGSNLPVEDWETIKNMTAATQPTFAGRHLYDPSFSGPSNDPQTVEEGPTMDARRAASGVVAYTVDKTTTDVGTVYQQYLTFLSSVIAQTTSNAIHDYFNENSLWVSSATDTTPYEVYGDNTLFRGADGGLGAQRTSEAATLSRASIAEILATGSSGTSTNTLRDLFPTRVGDTPGDVKPIEQWVNGKKDWAMKEIIESAPFWIKRVATQTFPRIVNLSQDQEFANLWYASLPSTQYWQVDVAATGDRVLAAAYGAAFELDPHSGVIRHSLDLAKGYDAKVATDGKTLFVGCHGYVYGVSLDDWSKIRWTTPMKGAAYCMVNLLYANGRLFAGSNAYALELDPGTGAVKNSTSVSRAVGPEVRLATDGSRLFVGCHGFAYGVQLSDWSTTWTAAMPHATYSDVTVLSAGGLLFAGSNGSAVQLDPANGDRVHDYTVTRAVDEPVTLATDGDTLAVGCNGYVTGIDLSDWSTAAYTTALSGIGWKPVTIRYANHVVYAGSNGYVHRLDATSGKVLNAVQIGHTAGSGDYTEALALDERGRLFVGMHGYAYAMS